MRTWPIALLRYLGLFAYLGAVVWAGLASGETEVSNVTLRFALVAVIALILVAWDVGRRGFHGWVRVAAGIAAVAIVPIAALLMLWATTALHVTPQHLHYWGWIATCIVAVLVSVAGFAIKAAGDRLWWRRQARRWANTRAVGVQGSWLPARHPPEDGHQSE